MGLGRSSLLFFRSLFVKFQFFKIDIAKELNRLVVFFALPMFFINLTSTYTAAPTGPFSMGIIIYNTCTRDHLWFSIAVSGLRFSATDCVLPGHGQSVPPIRRGAETRRDSGSWTLWNDGSGVSLSHRPQAPCYSSVLVVCAINAFDIVKFFD